MQPLSVLIATFFLFKGHQILGSWNQTQPKISMPVRFPSMNMLYLHENMFNLKIRRKIKIEIKYDSKSFYVFN